VVVIDGYNVSMLAWPDTPPAEQRDRLCDALAELHLRVRRPMVVVFDGAGIEGVPPLRRPGLSVVFSAREQEADEVVVDQVAARPLEARRSRARDRRAPPRCRGESAAPAGPR